jgi:MSHA biogenesis protein MshJ
MKRMWSILAARIDALSLRERAILFATLLVCSMLLADVLWLAPVQELHRQLTQRLTAQSAELQRLQEELKSSGGETGPGKLTREELVQIKARLEEVNKQIKKVPSSALDETPLSTVLVYFLRRHEGLTLVRTTTLNLEARVARDGASAGVTRQGLELTVAGPYPELMRYVQTLERSLPALRWGSMRIVSDKQPVLLTLQVSLVGVPQ